MQYLRFLCILLVGVGIQQFALAEWSLPPERVDPLAAPVNGSANIVAAHGTEHVAYRGIDSAAPPGSQDVIFYAQHGAGGWMAPVVVATIAPDTMGALNIEAYAGELFIIFDFLVRGQGFIYFVRYNRTDGATWTAPALLHASLASDGRAHFRVRTATSSNRFVAVWEADDPAGPGGVDMDILYSEFIADAWITPAFVNTTALGDAGGDFGADAVVRSDGTAYCVWESFEDLSGTGADADIFLSECPLGGAWSAPDLMNDDGDQDVEEDLASRVIYDEVNDQLFVLWERAEDIYYINFDAAKNLGPARAGTPAVIATYMLADSVLDTDWDVRVFTSFGIVYAVWNSSFDLGGSGTDDDIFWSRFENGAWSAPEFVNSAGSDGATDNVRPRVSNTATAAHIVWQIGANLFYQTVGIIGDTDSDGIADVNETNTGTYISPSDTGTDPNNPDSDGDGMPDGYEVDQGFDPTSSLDATLDRDRDGLTNLEECRLGTAPGDPNDPGSTVFVNDAAGDDTNGDGSPALPFKTITRGMAAAAGFATPGHRMEVRVADGVYDEYLDVPAFVTVRGSSAAGTVVESFDVNAVPNVLVSMTDDTELFTLTLRWPAALAAPSTLVRASLTGANVRFTIGGCILDGRNSTGSTAMEIAGGTAASAVLFENTIMNVTTALAAFDSGVNMTRNEIRDIAGDAVRVRRLPKSAKQSGFTVPLLGSSADVENTALNRFRNVKGLFIDNTTGVPVDAEVNDWGLYNQNDVGAKMTGDIDFGPIVGKSIGPGGVIASLYVGDTEQLVAAAANPTCTIPDLGLTGARDAASGLFIFESVSAGSWNIQGSADGYDSDTRNVNVTTASINPVNLHLTTQGTPPPPGGCGKTGPFAYAACGLVVWAAGKRVSGVRTRKRV